MPNTDEYRFNKKWISAETQTAVYRQFAHKDTLLCDGEKYVLSYTVSDKAFCGRLIKVLMKHLKVRDHVLSVAEGEGHLIGRLRNKGIRNIEGVDICEELVEIGKAKGLKMQVADAKLLPFKNNTFDVVIINEAIGALDVSKVLSECRRVLKQNGKIIITNYDYVEHAKEVIRSAVIKYKYLLSKSIILALKNKKFKKVQVESIAIKPIPKKQQEEGHVGDQLDIIIGFK